MQSICTFKSTILGDPRILMMAAGARTELNQDDKNGMGDDSDD